MRSWLIYVQTYFTDVMHGSTLIVFMKVNWKRGLYCEVESIQGAGAARWDNLIGVLVLYRRRWLLRHALITADSKEICA